MRYARSDDGKQRFFAQLRHAVSASQSANVDSTDENDLEAALGQKPTPLLLQTGPHVAQHCSLVRRKQENQKEVHN